MRDIRMMCVLAGLVAVYAASAAHAGSYICDRAVPDRRPSDAPRYSDVGMRLFKEFPDLPPLRPWGILRVESLGTGKEHHEKP